MRLNDLRDWLATVCANRPTKERLSRSCTVDDPSNPETLAESQLRKCECPPMTHDNRSQRREMSSGDRLCRCQRFGDPKELDRVLQGGQCSEALRRLQLMPSVCLRGSFMLPLLQVAAHVRSEPGVPAHAYRSLTLCCAQQPNHRDGRAAQMTQAQSYAGTLVAF